MCYMLVADIVPVPGKYTLTNWPKSLLSSVLSQQGHSYTQVLVVDIV